MMTKGQGSSIAKDHLQSRFKNIIFCSSDSGIGITPEEYVFFNVIIAELNIFELD